MPWSPQRQWEKTRWRMHPCRHSRLPPRTATTQGYHLWQPPRPRCPLALSPAPLPSSPGPRCQVRSNVNHVNQQNLHSHVPQPETNTTHEATHANQTRDSPESRPRHPVLNSRTCDPTASERHHERNRRGRLASNPPGNKAYLTVGEHKDVNHDGCIGSPSGTLTPRLHASSSQSSQPPTSRLEQHPARIHRSFPTPTWGRQFTPKDYDSPAAGGP